MRVWNPRPNSLLGRNLLTYFLLVSFTLTSLTLSSPSSFAQPPRGALRHDSHSPDASRILPDTLAALSLPSDLGTVDEIYLHEIASSASPPRNDGVIASPDRHVIARQRPMVPKQSRPFVILIQDAHAIPDAQKSIHKIVEFFQKEHGINLIALEGASGRLDPTLFRAFPDREILRRVFENYLARGELSGAAAASVLNEENADYYGIEDPSLYEADIDAFLGALEIQPILLQEIEAARSRLKNLKGEIYPAPLLEFDQALEAWETKTLDLAKVLNILSGISKPDPALTPHLAALLKDLEQTQSDSRTVRTELKRLAKNLRVKLQGRDEIRQFNSQVQAYETEQMGILDFAYYLRTETEQQGLKWKPSDELENHLGSYEKLRKIQGREFFEEFETYTKEAKGRLLQNEDQRQIDREDRKLKLQERLVKLELTRDEWNEIASSQPSAAPRNDGAVPAGTAKSAAPTGAVKAAVIARPQSGRSNLDFQSHIHFYELALRRDEAMVKNLMKLMIIGADPRVRPDRDTGQAQRPAPTAIVVTGGFHVKGMTEVFREKGISFALISPAMKELPVTNHYLDYMEGQVSWREYFKVKEDRIDLYEAFSRATVDQLLKRHGAWGQGQGKDGEPPAPRPLSPAPTLLKPWRDEVIRRLISEERITEAARYTHFLDEALTQHLDPARFEALKNEWRIRVGKFISGLRLLKREGKITPENIVRLANQPTAAAWNAAQGFVPGSTGPASWIRTFRAEARFEDEPPTDDEDKRLWRELEEIGRGINNLRGRLRRYRRAKDPSFIRGADAELTDYRNRYDRLLQTLPPNLGKIVHDVETFRQQLKERGDQLKELDLAINSASWRSARVFVSMLLAGLVLGGLVGGYLSQGNPAFVVLGALFGICLSGFVWIAGAVVAEIRTPRRSEAREEKKVKGKRKEGREQSLKENQINARDEGNLGALSQGKEKGDSPHERFNRLIEDRLTTRRAEVRGEKLGKGKFSNPDAVVIDNNDRRGQQFPVMNPQKQFESFYDQFGAEPPHAEKNHARLTRIREGQNSGEIKIHSHKNSIFTQSSVQDFGVRRFSKPNIANVDRVKTLSAEPARNPLRDGHIEQKLHGKKNKLSGSGKGLFPGEPGAILEGFSNVLQHQIGILGNNLFWFSPGREQIKDKVDRNSKPTKTRLSVKDSGVKGDTGKFWHPDTKATTRQTTRQLRSFGAHAEFKEVSVKRRAETQAQRVSNPSNVPSGESLKQSRTTEEKKGGDSPQKRERVRRSEARQPGQPSPSEPQKHTRRNILIAGASLAFAASIFFANNLLGRRGEKKQIKGVPVEVIVPPHEKFEYSDVDLEAIIHRAVEVITSYSDITEEMYNTLKEEGIKFEVKEFSKPSLDEVMGTEKWRFGFIINDREDGFFLTRESFKNREEFEKALEVSFASLIGEWLRNRETVAFRGYDVGVTNRVIRTVQIAQTTLPLITAGILSYGYYRYGDQESNLPSNEISPAAKKNIIKRFFEKAKTLRSSIKFGYGSLAGVVSLLLFARYRLATSYYGARDWGWNVLNYIDNAILNDAIYIPGYVGLVYLLNTLVYWAVFKIISRDKEASPLFEATNRIVMAVMAVHYMVDGIGQEFRQMFGGFRGTGTWDDILVYAIMGPLSLLFAYTASFAMVYRQSSVPQSVTKNKKEQRSIPSEGLTRRRMLTLALGGGMAAAIYFMFPTRSQKIIPKKIKTRAQFAEIVNKQLMHKTDANARLFAAHALGNIDLNIGQPTLNQAIEALFIAIQNAEAEIQQDAHRHKRAKIDTDRRREELQIINAAYESLSKIGKPVVPVAVELIKTRKYATVKGDLDILEHVIQALEKMDTQDTDVAIPVVLQVLSDADATWLEKAVAVRFLKKKKVKEAGPVMIRELRHYSYAGDKTVLGGVNIDLTSQHIIYRTQLIYAFPDMDYIDAAPILAEVLLKDEKGEVRRAAAYALQNMAKGIAATSHVGLVRNALQKASTEDKFPFVRDPAKFALATLNEVLRQRENPSRSEARATNKSEISFIWVTEQYIPQFGKLVQDVGRGTITNWKEVEDWIERFIRPIATEFNIADLIEADSNVSNVFAQLAMELLERFFIPRGWIVQHSSFGPGFSVGQIVRTENTISPAGRVVPVHVVRTLMGTFQQGTAAPNFIVRPIEADEAYNHQIPFYQKTWKAYQSGQFSPESIEDQSDRLSAWIFMKLLGQDESGQGLERIRWTDIGEELSHSDTLKFLIQLWNRPIRISDYPKAADEILKPSAPLRNLFRGLSKNQSSEQIELGNAIIEVEAKLKSLSEPRGSAFYGLFEFLLGIVMPAPEGAQLPHYYKIAHEQLILLLAEKLFGTRSLDSQVWLQFLNHQISNWDQFEIELQKAAGDIYAQEFYLYDERNQKIQRQPEKKEDGNIPTVTVIQRHLLGRLAREVERKAQDESDLPRLVSSRNLTAMANAISVDLAKEFTELSTDQIGELVLRTIKGQPIATRSEARKGTAELPGLEGRDKRVEERKTTQLRHLGVKQRVVVNQNFSGTIGQMEGSTAAADGILGINNQSNLGSFTQRQSSEGLQNSMFVNSFDRSGHRVNSVATISWPQNVVNEATVHSETRMQPYESERLRNEIMNFIKKEKGDSPREGGERGQVRRSEARRISESKMDLMGGEFFPSLPSVNQRLKERYSIEIAIVNDVTWLDDYQYIPPLYDTPENRRLFGQLVNHIENSFERNPRMAEALKLLKKPIVIGITDYIQGFIVYQHLGIAFPAAAYEAANQIVLALNGYGKAIEYHNNKSQNSHDFVKGKDFLEIDRNLSYEIARLLLNQEREGYTVSPVTQNDADNFLSKYPEVQMDKPIPEEPRARFYAIAEAIFKQRSSGSLKKGPFITNSSSSGVQEFMAEYLSIYILDPEFLFRQDRQMFDLLRLVQGFRKLLKRRGRFPAEPFPHAKSISNAMEVLKNLLTRADAGEAPLTAKDYHRLYVKKGFESDTKTLLERLSGPKLGYVERVYVETGPKARRIGYKISDEGKKIVRSEVREEKKGKGKWEKVKGKERGEKDKNAGTFREVNRLAEGDDVGQKSIQRNPQFSERGNLWSNKSNEASRSIHSSQHRRRQREGSSEGIHSIPPYSPGIDFRGDDIDSSSKRIGLSKSNPITGITTSLRRDNSLAVGTNKVAPLSSSFPHSPFSVSPAFPSRSEARELKQTVVANDFETYLNYSRHSDSVYLHINENQIRISYQGTEKIFKVNEGDIITIGNSWIRSWLPNYMYIEVAGSWQIRYKKNNWYYRSRGDKTWELLFSPAFLPQSQSIEIDTENSIQETLKKIALDPTGMEELKEEANWILEQFEADLKRFFSEKSYQLSQDLSKLFLEGVNIFRRDSYFHIWTKVDRSGTAFSISWSSVTNHLVGDSDLEKQRLIFEIHQAWIKRKEFSKDFPGHLSRIKMALFRKLITTQYPHIWLRGEGDNNPLLIEAVIMLLKLLPQPMSESELVQYRLRGGIDLLAAASWGVEYGKYDENDGRLDLYVIERSWRFFIELFLHEFGHVVERPHMQNDKFINLYTVAKRDLYALPSLGETARERKGYIRFVREFFAETFMHYILHGEQMAAGFPGLVKNEALWREVYDYYRTEVFYGVEYRVIDGKLNRAEARKNELSLTGFEGGKPLFEQSEIRRQSFKVKKRLLQGRKNKEKGEKTNGDVFRVPSRQQRQLGHRLQTWRWFLRACFTPFFWGAYKSSHRGIIAQSQIMRQYGLGGGMQSESLKQRQLQALFLRNPLVFFLQHLFDSIQTRASSFSPRTQGRSNQAVQSRLLKSDTKRAFSMEPLYQRMSLTNEWLKRKLFIPIATLIPQLPRLSAWIKNRKYFIFVGPVGMKYIDYLNNNQPIILLLAYLRLHSKARRSEARMQPYESERLRNEIMNFINGQGGNIVEAFGKEFSVEKYRKDYKPPLDAARILAASITSWVDGMNLFSVFESSVEDHPEKGKVLRLKFDIESRQKGSEAQRAHELRPAEENQILELGGVGAEPSASRAEVPTGANRAEVRPMEGPVSELDRMRRNLDPALASAEPLYRIGVEKIRKKKRFKGKQWRAFHRLKSTHRRILRDQDTWLAQNPKLHIPMKGKTALLISSEALLNGRQLREDLDWEDWLRRQRIDLEDPAAVAKALIGYEAALTYGNKVDNSEGGLGALAGDEARQLGRELAGPSALSPEEEKEMANILGIGLFHRDGILIPKIDEKGHQSLDTFTFYKKEDLPIETLQKEGQDVVLKIPFHDGEKEGVIQAKVEIVQVGKFRWALLNPAIPENEKRFQDIAPHPYPGEQNTYKRFLNEWLLGVGAMELVKTLGLDPGALHLNEQATVFSALALIQYYRKRYGLRYEEAKEVVREQVVFTTHTLEFAALGRYRPENIPVQKSLEALFGGDGEARRMAQDLIAIATDRNTIFPLKWALAFSRKGRRNGVSKFHADTSEKELSSYLPHGEPREGAFEAITNGVDWLYWLADAFKEVLTKEGGRELDPDKVLGLLNPEDPDHQDLWKWMHGTDKLPENWGKAPKTLSDEALQRIQRALKKRLIGFVRSRMARQIHENMEAIRARIGTAHERPVDPENLAKLQGRFERIPHLLDLEKPIITWARRGVPYKRMLHALVGERIDLVQGRIGNLVEQWKDEIKSQFKPLPEESEGDYQRRLEAEFNRRMEAEINAIIEGSGEKKGYLEMGYFNEFKKLVLEDGGQFIFAGRVHPKNLQGRAEIYFLNRVVEKLALEDPRFGDAVLFLPEYGAEAALALAQGSDISLATPEPPNEASGTSPEKYKMNSRIIIHSRDGFARDLIHDRKNGLLYGPLRLPPPRETLDRPQYHKEEAEDLYRTLHEAIGMVKAEDQSKNVAMSRAAMVTGLTLLTMERVERGGSFVPDLEGGRVQKGYLPMYAEASRARDKKLFQLRFFNKMKLRGTMELRPGRKRLGVVQAELAVENGEEARGWTFYVHWGFEDREGRWKEVQATPMQLKPNGDHSIKLEAWFEAPRSGETTAYKYKIVAAPPGVQIVPGTPVEEWGPEVAWSGPEGVNHSFEEIKEHVTTVDENASYIAQLTDQQLRDPNELQRLADTGSRLAILPLIRSLSLNKDHPQLRQVAIRGLEKSRRYSLPYNESQSTPDGIMGKISEAREWPDIDVRREQIQRVIKDGGDNRVVVEIRFNRPDLRPTEGKVILGMGRALEHLYGDLLYHPATKDKGYKLEVVSDHDNKIVITFNVQQANLTQFMEGMGTWSFVLDDKGNLRPFRLEEILNRLGWRTDILLPSLEFEDERRQFGHFLQGDGTPENPGFLEILRHPEQHGNLKLIVTGKSDPDTDRRVHVSYHDLVHVVESAVYYAHSLPTQVRTDSGPPRPIRRTLFLSGMTFLAKYLEDALKGEGPGHRNEMFFLSRETLGPTISGEMENHLETQRRAQLSSEFLELTQETQEFLEERYLKNRDWRAGLDSIYAQLETSGTLHGLEKNNPLLIVAEPGDESLAMIAKYIVAKRSKEASNPIDVYAYAGALQESVLRERYGLSEEDAARIAQNDRLRPSVLLDPLRINPPRMLPVQGSQLAIRLEEPRILLAAYLRAMLVYNALIEFYNNLAVKAVASSFENDPDADVREAARQALVEMGYPLAAVQVIRDPEHGEEVRSESRTQKGSSEPAPAVDDAELQNFATSLTRLTIEQENIIEELGNLVDRSTASPLERRAEVRELASKTKTAQPIAQPGGLKPIALTSSPAKVIQRISQGKTPVNEGGRLPPAEGKPTDRGPTGIRTQTSSFAGDALSPLSYRAARSESRPGLNNSQLKYNEFEIGSPRAEARAKREKPKTAALAGPNEIRLLRPKEGLKTVLIAEDASNWSRVLSEEFDSEGRQVVVKADGKQAMDFLIQSGNPDEAMSLLSTDNDMPGMSGIELIMALRKQGYRMPIILHTGDLLKLSFKPAPERLILLAKGSTDFKQIIARLAKGESIKAVETAPPNLKLTSKAKRRLNSLLSQFRKLDDAIWPDKVGQKSALSFIEEEKQNSSAFHFRQRFVHGLRNVYGLLPFLIPEGERGLLGISEHLDLAVEVLDEVIRQPLNQFKLSPQQEKKIRDFVLPKDIANGARLSAEKNQFLEEHRPQIQKIRDTLAKISSEFAKTLSRSEVRIGADHADGSSVLKADPLRAEARKLPLSLRGGRQADEAIARSEIASASFETLPRNDEIRRAEVRSESKKFLLLLRRPTLIGDDILVTYQGLKGGSGHFRLQSRGRENHPSHLYEAILQGKKVLTSTEEIISKHESIAVLSGTRRVIPSWDNPWIVTEIAFNTFGEQTVLYVKTVNYSLRSRARALRVEAEGRRLGFYDAQDHLLGSVELGSSEEKVVRDLNDLFEKAINPELPGYQIIFADSRSNAQTRVRDALLAVGKASVTGIVDELIQEFPLRRTPRIYVGIIPEAHDIEASPEILELPMDSRFLKDGLNEIFARLTMKEFDFTLVGEPIFTWRSWIGRLTGRIPLISNDELLRKVFEEIGNRLPLMLTRDPHRGEMVTPFQFSSDDPQKRMGYLALNVVSTSREGVIRIGFAVRAAEKGFPTQKVLIRGWIEATEFSRAEARLRPVGRIQKDDTENRAEAREVEPFVKGLFTHLAAQGGLSLDPVVEGFSNLVQNLEPKAYAALESQMQTVAESPTILQILAARGRGIESLEWTADDQSWARETAQTIRSISETTLIEYRIEGRTRSENRLALWSEGLETIQNISLINPHLKFRIVAASRSEQRELSRAWGRLTSRNKSARLRLDQVEIVRSETRFGGAGDTPDLIITKRSLKTLRFDSAFFANGKPIVYGENVTPAELVAAAVVSLSEKTVQGLRRSENRIQLENESAVTPFGLLAQQLASEAAAGITTESAA